MLVAEAAFGEQLCSPKTARDLAKRVFERIEVGGTTEAVSRSLSLAVGGLNSDLVKKEVETAIDRWFPRRFSYLSYIYEAVGKWPIASDSVEFLIRGISEEDEINRRAAAKALGQSSGGTEEIHARLAAILKAPDDLSSFYGALEALYIGWKESEILEKALGSASADSDPFIRILSIKFRAHRGQQTEDDLKWLLWLSSDSKIGAWRWRQDVVDCLEIGWPDDDEVRKRCIASIGYGPRDIDNEVASQVLISRVAQPGVEAAIRESIRSGRFSIMDRRRLWSQIGDIRPSGLFSEDIDHWLREDDKSILMSAEAAEASGSDWARDHLIGFLEEDRYSAAHAADGLVRRWGVNDPAVHAAFLAAKKGSKSSKLAIAPYLGDLAEDAKASRKFLLKLLKKSKKRQVYRVMRGFRSIGVTHGDDEVMEKLLELEFNSDKGPLSNAEDELIRNFSDHPKVQEIAIAELQRRHGSITAIAACYSHHNELRKGVLSLNMPLRRALRLRLVERLGREAVNKDYPVLKLSQYDAEDDGAVKALASIEYHRSIQGKTELVEQATKDLTKRLHVIGPDMDARRAAGLLGLVALDRADIFRDAVDHDEKAIAIDGLGTRRSESHPAVLRFIADNWSRLEGALGDTVLDRVSRYAGDGGAPLALLAPFADEVPGLSAIILDFISREQSPYQLPVEILKWLSRKREHRSDLLNVCRRILSRPADRYTWFEASTAITAGRILGDIFRGDNEVQRIAEAGLAKDDRGISKNGYLIALCTGWPDSESLETLFKTYTEEPPNDLLAPASIALVSVKSPPEIVREWIYSIVRGPDIDNWDFTADCVPPLVRRIREDQKLVEEMIADLQKTPTPDQKATIPGLIVAGSGENTELTDWCTAELAEGRDVAEVGFDLVHSSNRLVRESLFDAVGQIYR